MPAPVTIPTTTGVVIDTTPIPFTLAPPAYQVQPGIATLYAAPVWDGEPTLQSGVLFVELVTLDATVPATDNRDGSGASYTLTSEVAGGSPYRTNTLVQVTINNTTDHDLFVQSLSGTLIRVRASTTATTVTPPSTTGPTNTPGTTPTTILEKANPGFTCEIKRLEHYEDLGTVQLAQRVNLTAPMLGFTNRGHVVTIIKHDIVAGVQGDEVAWTLESRYTLEKISGTLLPGAGTSTAAQDAANTGAELGAYLRFDDAASGFDIGSFAA